MGEGLNMFLLCLIFQAFCQVTDPLHTIPNKNSCLFQLEIYSLFYVFWNYQYLFPLFLHECQVLLLHHLYPSVLIQSCKAEQQVLCVTFHTADWDLNTLGQFSHSQNCRWIEKVPREWHIVYLHSPNILCINWSIFTTW